MRVAFYEDGAATDFQPLTYMRPVFELICGHYSLRERVIRHFSVTQWGAFLRGFLEETYREAQPEARVNDFSWLHEDDTLLINGRWLSDHKALDQIQPDEVGVIDDTIVTLTIQPDEGRLLSLDDWTDGLRKIAQGRREVKATGKLLKRPWELIEQNPRQIVADFSAKEPETTLDKFGSQVALIGPGNLLHINSTAQIEPFVVFDTRSGPISIGAGAVIQSFTRLQGPCHVGCGAKLFCAHVREGTTIGQQCRVGGEIEASIFHGYANKYHDGFVGHSYICPWVNLGAETTTSDLKSDYSQVRVPLAGEMLETHLLKVGCFIGDHTKTGLASLFNAGSSVGVMSMILPAGELLPKFIPSFSSVWQDHLVPRIGLEQSLTAARIAMQRRDCLLTDAQERLLRHLHQATAQERDDAAVRLRDRRARQHHKVS